MGGTVGKESGETGQQEEPSWVTKDSLLGEVIIEGEAVPEDEEGIGVTGMVVESEEGMRVMLVVEVAGSEGAVI